MLEFPDEIAEELCALDSEAIGLARLLPPDASWNEIRLELLLREVAQIRVRLKRLESCPERGGPASAGYPRQPKPASGLSPENPGSLSPGSP